MNQMELENTITQALILMKLSKINEAEKLLQEANESINESHLKMYHGTRLNRRHDDK